MINDTIPEIPSQLSQANLLPQKSDNIQTILTFQEYIPVACFCDKARCKATVESIEPPILGLYTREGKIVKSLEIEVKEGELMYIILIDPNSDLGNDTYLERTIYWHLTDGQHQLLAGASFELQVPRQVSVAEIKDINVRYYVESESKNIVISALEMVSGLTINTPEELENKNSYRFSPSSSVRTVGVYQLFDEVTIHPSTSLTNYIEKQQSGASCPQYLIFKHPCGVIQLVPSFRKRTSIFSQVAIDITTTDPTTIIVPASTSVEISQSLSTTTISSATTSKKSLSKSAKATLISVSIVAGLLITLVGAIGCYVRSRRAGEGTRHVRLSLLPDDADGNQEQI